MLNYNYIASHRKAKRHKIDVCKYFESDEFFKYATCVD